MPVIEPLFVILTLPLASMGANRLPIVLVFVSSRSPALTLIPTRPETVPVLLKIKLPAASMAVSRASMLPLESIMLFAPILNASEKWLTRPSPELCLILGDGVDQAANFTSCTTSIPSLNFTPLMIFGN